MLLDAQPISSAGLRELDFDFEFLLSLGGELDFDLNRLAVLEGDLPVVARHRKFGPRLNLVGEFAEEGRGRLTREVDFALEVAVGDHGRFVHLVARQVCHAFEWVVHTLNLAHHKRSLSVINLHRWSVADIGMSLFDVLGSKARLKIIRELASEPRYVSELAERVGMDGKSAVHHLSALEDAGLVESYETSRRKYYRLVQVVELRASPEARTFVLHAKAAEPEDEEDER